MLSLHRTTSSSSTKNSPWLSPCLLVRVLLLLLPRNGHGPIVNTCHVTTHRCVTSPRTRKTQPPLLLRNPASDCLPKICLRGNLLNNMLPSNECICNNIHHTKQMEISHGASRHWTGCTMRLKRNETIFVTFHKNFCLTTFLTHCVTQ
jgi:hypothetical protein